MSRVVQWCVVLGMLWGCFVVALGNCPDHRYVAWAWFFGVTALFVNVVAAYRILRGVD